MLGGRQERRRNQRWEQVKQSPRAAVGLVMPQVTVTWGPYQVCDALGGPYPPAPGPLYQAHQPTINVRPLQVRKAWWMLKHYLLGSSRIPTTAAATNGAPSIPIPRAVLPHFQ